MRVTLSNTLIILIILFQSCTGGKNENRKRIRELDAQWSLQKMVFNDSFKNVFFYGAVEKVEIIKDGRASIFKIYFKSQSDFFFDKDERMISTFLFINNDSLSFIYTIEDLYDYDKGGQRLLFSKGDSIYKLKSDSLFYLSNDIRKRKLQGSYPLWTEIPEQ